MLDACNNGNLFKVMEYIAQGVDVNMSVGNPDEKRSLLCQVVITGKATTYTLELLIQNGAQVYAGDAKGWTPLHYAAYYDRVTYARMLRMRGASENAEDKQQKTPVNIAEEQANSQTLKYFRKEIKDEDLAGVQPSDIESLRLIKENFSSTAAVIRSKLDLLRQELQVTTSVEEALDIVKKMRLVKLTMCFEA